MLQLLRLRYIAKERERVCVSRPGAASKVILRLKDFKFPKNRNERRKLIDSENLPILKIVRELFNEKRVRLSNRVRGEAG